MKKLLTFGEFVNESSQFLNESFKSPILNNLLRGDGNNRFRDISTVFYNLAKIALDQVEDSDITKMDPIEAYKSFRKTGGTNLIAFYLSEGGGENQYAKESWEKTIAPNTLLAVASGNNEFYSINYGRWSLKASLTTSGDKGAAVGSAKSSYAGLNSVKRVSEVADVAYVIDLDILRAKYGTQSKIKGRAEQKEGAIAFTSPDQFKKDNLERYRSILRDRVASTGVDDLVLSAISTITDQIKNSVVLAHYGQKENLAIGTDSKGRKTTVRDATHFLASILDTFEEYVRYSNSADRTGNQLYKLHSKELALQIKEKIARLNTYDYSR